MNDELYSVVFTGRLVKGVSGKQALENLTQLFRKSSDEIRKVFTKPGTVIRSKLPLIKAERMLVGLTKAGVVCRLQPETVASMPSSVSPVVSADPSAAPEKPARSLLLISGNTDLTLSPIGCGRLSIHEGGLETARLDRSFIAYSDILAATAFSSKEGSANLHLLLFTAGHKRPLLIEGLQIAFRDFPEVQGDNLHSSLRNFINYLVAQNPELRCDEKTDTFIDGGGPLLFSDEPVILASQVHAALVLSNVDLERTAISAPEPGSVALPRPMKPPVQKSVSVVQTPDSSGPVREIDLRAELDDWVGYWPIPLAITLLVGLLLPLIKHSLLLGTVNLVWFWDLFDLGLDGQNVTTMATYFSGQGRAAYAILPLVSAGLILLTAFAVPKRWRGPILLTAGLMPLILAFTVSYKGGEIYDIIFLPVSTVGGVLMLLLLVSALLVAAVNHLGKQSIVHPHLRAIQMGSGLVLLVLTLLAFISPDWNSVAFYILYLLWLAIALLAINGTISGRNNQRNQTLISILFRLTLVLTPIAVIVTQSLYNGPDSVFMVEGGDSLVPLVIATVKAFLVYYSMAMAVGVGLVQVLGRRYAGRF